MNTTVQPLQRILALVARMRASFPECGLSLSLLWEWSLAQLGLQRKWSGEARAVDDEMERVAPLLADCLKNDPPAKRRVVWAAWQETHRRAETLAAAITPER